MFLARLQNSVAAINHSLVPSLFGDATPKLLGIQIDVHPEALLLPPGICFWQ